MGRTTRNVRPRDKKDPGLNAKHISVAQVAPGPHPGPAPSTPALLPPMLPPEPSTPPAATVKTSNATPSTPSLKIRLPRMSAVNFQSLAAPVQTPTRSSSSSSAQNSTDSRLRRSSRHRLCTSASMSMSTDSSSSFGLSGYSEMLTKPNGSSSSTTPP